MTHFQKRLIYIEKFIFVVSFLQALEWIYQKIIIVKDKLKKLPLDSKQVNYCLAKNYWGKVLFIAGARIDLEEKETMWKRIQENYWFLEKQINNYIGQISGKRLF